MDKSSTDCISPERNAVENGRMDGWMDGTEGTLASLLAPVFALMFHAKMLKCMEIHQTIHHFENMYIVSPT